MIITMIEQQRISTTYLPKRVGGRYWVSGQDAQGSVVNVADIEGVQDAWRLHCSSLLALFDERGAETDSLPLREDTQVISARQRQSGAPVQIFVEPSSEDRRTYRKYCVQDNCRLNIGRAADNQIVFDNRYVSSHHACLVWENQRWTITDTQSRNGTFLNEARVATSQLAPGDVVYIMGLKIIAGNGFFAINDPDGAVQVSAGAIAELAGQTPEEKGVYQASSAPEVFLGSPRIRRSFEKKVVAIDPPPTRQRSESTPLALLIGPALTMGMTAVAMASVAVINYLNGTSELVSLAPTLVMSFSMLCGTLLWPMLTKRAEKKRQAAEEEKRKKRYLAYLDEVRNEIFRHGEAQKALLLENCPSISQCAAWIQRRDRRLWERSVGQDDFLNLRLGLGEVPLDVEVRYPDKRFSAEDDPLQNELYRLSESGKNLSGAPITCSLQKNRMVGIIGGTQDAMAFLQGLVLQAAALHSYEQLKLMFFLEEGEAAAWDAFKFLPHTQDESADLCGFAVGGKEANVLALTLGRIFSERKEKRGVAPEEAETQYLLVVPNAALTNKIELFGEIAAAKEGLGFSVLTMAPRMMDLPQGCSAIIELTGGGASVYGSEDASGTMRSFAPETPDPAAVRGLCEVLGNLVMHTQAEKHELPSLLTFHEMFGVGKTEHLNALTRWRENSAVNTLQAPVGVGEDGALIYLDLHEKVHGPHGLVAGMTGSGKSEFVITYLLSMAVNYHPDEVSFILIDYKGGGLAGAFEDRQKGIHLPHLAGTITNLDGTAVNRALISIQSELRRRQSIFNAAKQVSGEGTIDIYKYHKLYRSGAVKEPVPHLLIVSDEFAELKVQQPDFMAQLISAARIGRSLGVHLILATQKPSGVVDDQIWSNSRFRVCLKVQERADSTEMLKRPDAAELKDSGRFYMQVGFNELFELGQSAWSGAPYIPVDRVEKKQDDCVAVVDHLGRVLIETRPRADVAAAKTSQVVSVVKYLSDLAKEGNISTRQLWLPEIPALIYLDDLIEKYHWAPKALELAPVIGEYDDPFNQAQGLLTLSFSEGGNALVYGAAGGGKNTLLNTLLVDLLRRYSAEQLNVYIVDLGEETLRVFADAPQVGDVLLSTDGEKVVSLFKMLTDEITARKRLFVEGDGSYVSYCQSTGQTLPQLLVIIRNYSAFAEQFESLDDRLIQITRECSKYGIYFLVTANAANTIRYRVAQNFGNLFALQLNDPSDYIGLFGGTGGTYPSKIKGRGLFKTDRAYEFQCAHFAPDASQQALRRLVEGLAADATVFAPAVPSLPERVVPSCFNAGFTTAAVPVGVEKVSLQPALWNLDKNLVTLILSQNSEELAATALGVAEQLARLDGRVTVLDGDGSLAESGELTYDYLQGSFAGRVETLFSEMVRRNNTYKQAVANGQPTEDYAFEYYVITGLPAILAGLDEAGRDRLNTLLEKAELHYNMRFVVCGSAKMVSEVNTLAWYRRHVSGNDGIWVGDGIAEQYAIKVGKLTNSLYSEVPPHFGYLVWHGKPVLAKLIIGETYKEAER